MTCNNPGFVHVAEKSCSSGAEIEESFEGILSEVKMARERRTGRTFKVNSFLTSVIAEKKGTLEYVRGVTSWLEDWV